MVVLSCARVFAFLQWHDLSSKSFGTFCLLIVPNVHQGSGGYTLGIVLRDGQLDENRTDKGL